MNIFHHISNQTLHTFYGEVAATAATIWKWSRNENKNANFFSRKWKKGLRIVQSVSRIQINEEK